jgi:NAD(P)-dependent dehydrogenase (short-subunit alcohol dehydrogenase family)
MTAGQATADLSGRVAVVTGAAGGLGAAIADRLAASGAHVWSLDLDEDRVAARVASIQKAGGSASGARCDVSDANDVAHVAAEIRAAGRPVDVLVNNAGIVRSAPLEDLSVDDWRAVTAVNLDGCFLCTQAFGRMMLEQGRGAIVNIASIAALVASPGRGAYSATKGAILSLTRQTALEWGDRGVRANAVCPGLVESGMGKSAVPRSEGKRSLIPLGRFATHEDVAHLVTFLASDLAGYITGETVTLDGGLSGAVLRELHTR